VFKEHNETIETRGNVPQNPTEKPKSLICFLRHFYPPTERIYSDFLGLQYIYSKQGVCFKVKKTHRLTGEKLSARAGLEREMQTSCG